MSKTFEAISVFIGTMVGAGILGIPYVVMKSGFTIGLLHIIIIASLMLLICLYLGEIALRTKETHQLSGYAEKYLGKKGKLLMTLAFAFGIYSALLAYLIGEGRSLSYLLFGTSQYELYLGIAFWIFLSLISFKGIRTLKKGEPIGIIFVLVMIISITLLFWNKIDISNLQTISLSNSLFPFGVILFAFLGFSAIPEMERILGKDKKRMKRAIFTAIGITALIYILFTFVVIGAKGVLTPQIATIALGKPFIILGMLTMFTAYLALSIAMMDMFKFDYHKSKTKSWICTIIIPLIIYMFLYFTDNMNFTKVIGIGGVISGGLTAFLILAMVKQAKKYGDVKPDYHMPYSSIIKWTLGIIFIIGMIAEVLYSLK